MAQCVTHTYDFSGYSRFMASERQTWSDERMDEFARRTEENFREIRGEVGGLRTEMNGRFAALESKIEQRFNILFGAMATGFVGAVVSHFLG